MKWHLHIIFKCLKNTLMLLEMYWCYKIKKWEKLIFLLATIFFKNDSFFKMLVIVLYFRLLLSIWPGNLNPQSFNLCPFLTHSVRNGPSVSFGLMSPVLWNLHSTSPKVKFWNIRAKYLHVGTIEGFKKLSL